MNKIIALAIATSFSAAAFAAPETYVLEQNHTKPRFEYSHMGYSTQLSRFDTAKGTVTIDRAAKTGSVDVTIDATSVNTGSDMFNGHIQGEDFFDTAKFPTITYKSDKFKFEGDKLVGIEGNLTIKGVTKPVTLTVTSFMCMPHPMMKKEACGASAGCSTRGSGWDSSAC